MPMVARTSLATAIGILCLSAVEALAAVDAAKFRAALQAQLENFGPGIAFGSVEASGEDIILKDLRVTSDKGQSTTFPSVRLENVTAIRGGFNVGRIAVPANTFPMTEGVFEFGGASVSNIIVPEVNAPKDVVFYALKVDIGAMRVLTTGGQEFMRIGRALMNSTPISLDRESTFVVEPVEIFVDMTVAPKKTPQEVAAEETLRALGLAKMNLSVSTRGAWRPSDGWINSDTTFALRDAGTLAMKFEMTGYTLDVVHAMNAAMKATAPPPNATPQQKKDSEAKAGLALVGIAQNLSLGLISLRYDDASLANRLLDYTAKQNGTARRDLINQIKGMVPIIAMQTQDADFATSASNAVSAFLDNPKSIEVRAQPAAPVPFMQIFAIGAMSPQALIKQLKVAVTANQ